MGVRKSGKKFILAGGINPDNVFKLINTVKPDGIDVGSGVEESKGKKSKEKMKKLFEEIDRVKCSRPLSQSASSRFGSPQGDF